MRFIANWSRTEASLPVIGLVLAILLVAWQPFSGNARAPATLLVLLGIFWIWRHPEILRQRAFKRLAMVMALLFVGAAISFPGSYDPTATLNVFPALLAGTWMGIALLQVLQHPLRLQQLQWWFLIIVLVWTFDGLYQAAMGQDILGIPMREGRVVGPFAGRFRLGIFLSVLMPIALWSWARSRPAVAALVMLSVGAVIVLSGNRSAFVMYLLASAVLLLRFAPMLRVVLAVSGALVITVLSMQQDHLAERFHTVSRLLVAPQEINAETLDRATAGRSLIWQTAWEMLKARPLAGVGAKAFSSAYDFYSPHQEDRFRSSGTEPVHHAHSMFVAQAAEMGLIGLFVLGAIAWLIVVWWRQAPAGGVARQRAAPFLASLFVLAFPLQSQPQLSHVWWFPVVVLLLVCYLAALEPESDAAGEVAS